MTPTTLAQLRSDAASRFRTKVATLPRAEVETLHEALCERFERAMVTGGEMLPREWDELAVLQQRRAELLEPVQLEPPPVYLRREVINETAYGRTVRMAWPVRCF